MKNAWNFERTSEEIRINGKQVYHREIPMGEASLKSVVGLCFEHVENGTRITVKMGSAWHMCGTACQVLIDGRYHYGNRIVLFAGKRD